MSRNSGSYLLDDYDEIDEFDEFDELEKFGKLSEIEEIPKEIAMNDFDDIEEEEDNF